MRMDEAIETMTIRREGPGPGQKVTLDTQAWLLDRTHWMLLTPNDKGVRLTAMECGILDVLMKHCGHTVGRSEIEQVLGLSNDTGNPNRIVDVTISRLRRKVLTASGLMLPVRAVQKQGYVLTARANVLQP